MKHSDFTTITVVYGLMIGLSFLTFVTAVSVYNEREPKEQPQEQPPQCQPFFNI